MTIASAYICDHPGCKKAYHLECKSDYIRHLKKHVNEKWDKKYIKDKVNNIKIAQDKIDNIEDINDIGHIINSLTILEMGFLELGDVSNFAYYRDRKDLKSIYDVHLKNPMVFSHLDITKEHLFVKFTIKDDIDADVIKRILSSRVGIFVKYKMFYFNNTISLGIKKSAFNSTMKTLYMREIAKRKLVE